MNSQEYQANALRTESIPKSLEMNEISLHAILTVLIGTTEIADLVKRKLYYGKPISDDKLMHNLAGIAGALSYLAESQNDNPAAINSRLLLAKRTELEGFMKGQSLPNIDKVNIRLLHCALGMFTESGELLQVMMKQFETGELDKVNFGEEIGDSAWYQAIGFDETGVSEETTRAKNIAKLKVRYADKFSEEAALNRDLTAERAILEGCDVLTGKTE